MTLANDAIQATPGSGATLAMHSPQGSGTTRHQAMMLANAFGEVRDLKRSYIIQTPDLLYQQNGRYWEIFNGSASNVTVIVHRFGPQVSIDQAISGGVSVRADIFRTTAVGSGGTAFNIESTSTTSVGVARWDTADTTWPSGITIQTRLASVTTGSWVATLCTTRNETVGDWLAARRPVLGAARGFCTDLKLRANEGLMAFGTQSGGTHSWFLEVSIVS